MPDHDRKFGDSLPETTDIVGNFSSEVNEFSNDVEQRLTLDHYMDGVLTDGAPNQDGRHRQVTMKKVVSDPLVLADTGIVFTKDVSDITELHYKDSSNNIVQITEGGGLKYASVVENLGAVFEDFVVIDGIAGIASVNSVVLNTEPYPPGYTAENSIIIMGRVYNSDILAYETLTTFQTYAGGPYYYGGTITFKGSNIEIITTYYHNSQSYKLILGKLT